MNKHLALIKCTGHSGSGWLQQILNYHNNIMVFGEPTNRLRIDYIKAKEDDPDLDYSVKLGERKTSNRADMSLCYSRELIDDILFTFISHMCCGGFHRGGIPIKQRPEKTISLIKGVTTRLIQQCKSLKTTITEFAIIRHPIPVIEFYLNFQARADLPKGWMGPVNNHNDFVKYVAKFQREYQNIEKNKCYKIEDINKSIETNKVLFKTLIEKEFLVECDNKFLQQVINSRPSFKECEPYQDIWKSWEQYKKDLFVEYFDEILGKLGYVI